MGAGGWRKHLNASAAVQARGPLWKPDKHTRNRLNGRQVDEQLQGALVVAQRGHP